MTFHISLEDFLAKNRIASDVWKCADIAWESLRSIANDHLARQTELSETAELCARVMQKLPKVHSVRWRVKDVEHLLEKIIRKRAAEGESNKYLAIGLDNYHEIVTDLVGLRALHLFKDECFEIDTALRAAFVLLEGEARVAFVRAGDPPELLARFEKADLRVEQHAAGYRSVHYVVATQPLQRRIAAEVQVRTIFEEGWSEIDHKVRYPNFSNDPQISYFLRIFNGLAGSADEMGSFVRGLVKALEVNQSQVAEANENYERTLLKLEATVAKLDEVRESSVSTDANVVRLRRELAELRAASAQAATVHAQRSSLSGLGMPSLTSSSLGIASPNSLGLGLGTNLDAFKNQGLGLGAFVAPNGVGLGLRPTDPAFASVGVSFGSSADTLKGTGLGLSAIGAPMGVGLGPSLRTNDPPFVSIRLSTGLGLSAIDVHQSANLGAKDQLRGQSLSSTDSLTDLPGAGNAPRPKGKK